MAPIAAAVLPHPPLLVPELAGTAASELDPLRAACHQALAGVTAAADRTVLVGTGPVWAVPAPSAPGSFRPYGADLEVALPALAALDPPPARLAAICVPPALGPAAAAAIGHTLAATAGSGPGGPPTGRLGLVVLGDLSACRTDRAPGAFHPEAAAFDASIGEAFRSASPHRLLDLDPAQAAGLLATARVPLQVLAGAFRRDGPRPHGQVLYEDAPYGVGYLVAMLSGPAP